MSEFASTKDLEAKKISFGQIGPGCYAFTAQGDPNSGVIVTDEGAVVIDAQATPRLAGEVVARVREVTDKPVTHLVLTHYHAVRVLGASAYGASEIVMSAASRELVAERGQQDWDSEFGRFPRLFAGHEQIPGLTWPTLTFSDSMAIYSGGREIRVVHMGRGHTAGDTAVWVPDCKVMFAGDLVECRSACYCGDAYLREWPATLGRIAEHGAQALVPGRGDALASAAQVREAIDLTRDFISTLFGSASAVAAKGGSLKDAYGEACAAMDPKFGSWPIYEHCQPFNVARAYEEASGREHPTIWTAERDNEMWAALAR